MNTKKLIAFAVATAAVVVVIIASGNLGGSTPSEENINLPYFFTGFVEGLFSYPFL